MKSSTWFATLSMSVVLLGAGCSLVDHVAAHSFKYRVAHSRVFASLTAEQKERLARGLVATGDTKEMVYLALGEPDRVRSAKRDQVWDYYSFPRGGESVSSDRPAEFSSGTPKLLLAVAFKGEVVAGIVQPSRSKV